MDPMKDIDRITTMTGSTRRPGASSVYKRIIVLDEPPAPAAREDVGSSFDDLALLRVAVVPVGKATAFARPTEGEAGGLDMFRE